MGGKKKKNMALSTLFIQARSKMQQPSHQFKQEKKSTVISVQTKQMLTELNNQFKQEKKLSFLSRQSRRY